MARRKQARFGVFLKRKNVFSSEILKQAQSLLSRSLTRGLHAEIVFAFLHKNNEV